jgi:hypothetical protein
MVGAQVRGLGADEPTCTPLATPLLTTHQTEPGDEATIASDPLNMQCMRVHKLGPAL